jgi:hypothetical protein
MSAFPAPSDVIPNGAFLVFREDVVFALRHRGRFHHRCRFLSASEECQMMAEWLEKLRSEAESACWDTEFTTTTENDFTTMTLRIADEKTVQPEY